MCLPKVSAYRRHFDETKQETAYNEKYLKNKYFNRKVNTCFPKNKYQKNVLGAFLYE